jgi:hypothetical protein
MHHQTRAARKEEAMDRVEHDERSGTMRLEADTKVWVVVDPSPRSELADVCFECSLRKLELQFRGGLTCEQNPTVFTDREEAETEAFGRLTAMRAAEAIAAQARAGVLAGPCKVVIHGADGRVVFEAEVGEQGTR